MSETLFLIIVCVIFGVGILAGAIMISYEGGQESIRKQMREKRRARRQRRKERKRANAKNLP